MIHPYPIDLHSHSYYSDGTSSPTQLVDLAREARLSVLALTDHDSLEGVEEALAAAESSSLLLLPGVEMSAAYGSRELHILGYLSPETYQRNKAKLTKALGGFLAERRARNEEMLCRFQEAGIPLTMEEVSEGRRDAAVTRAHFANALIKRGLAKDKEAAFSKYLQTGGPYCPPKTVTVERVMDFFARFGFFSSLAHPYLYKLSGRELEEALTLLKKAGLCGIEIYHSTHHASDTARLRILAEKYALLPTGGSDFHGANKPGIHLGVGFGGMYIPYDVYRPIASYCSAKDGVDEIPAI